MLFLESVHIFKIESVHIQAQVNSMQFKSVTRLNSIVNLDYKLQKSFDASNFLTFHLRRKLTRYE